MRASRVSGGAGIPELDSVGSEKENSLFKLFHPASEGAESGVRDHPARPLLALAGPGTPSLVLPYVFHISQEN